MQHTLGSLHANRDHSFIARCEKHNLRKKLEPCQILNLFNFTDMTQSNPLRSDFFTSAPTLASRAPGRIEFIGNHTDYNGGDVLGAAIDRYVSAHCAPRKDRVLRFVSDLSKEVVTTDLDHIDPIVGSQSWANYPLGVIKCFIEAGGVLNNGFEIAYSSDLPTGAGLSSSAAIELATLELLDLFTGSGLSRKQKVLMAQKAENEFVGVPCGMLDQAVSCFGETDHLVHIRCAAVEFSRVPMPPGCHFWIFNTNEKHSLVDSLYSTRNRECRKALELCRERVPGLPHLVSATPELLESALSGEADLLKRARHVVTEHQRVQRCLDTLRDGDLTMVGKLLFDSHESSRQDFQNSTEALDTWIRILADCEGVHGARLTGGGFGGAVMALTTSAFDEQSAEESIRRYEAALPDAPRPAAIHVQTGDGSQSHFIQEG